MSDTEYPVRTICPHCKWTNFFDISSLRAGSLFIRTGNTETEEVLCTACHAQYTITILLLVDSR